MGEHATTKASKLRAAFGGSIGDAHKLRKEIEQSGRTVDDYIANKSATPALMGDVVPPMKVLSFAEQLLSAAGSKERAIKALDALESLID